LLHLAAAFDTVDHGLLFDMLIERQFGLRGIVLAWFQSHLSDRTFRFRDQSVSLAVVTYNTRTTFTPTYLSHLIHD